MGQIGKAPDEVAFQKALIDLRYMNCSEDEIALFKSRVASKNTGLSVDQPEFKNVSIIMTYNRVKDQINDANSIRFAQEVGEKIYEFYCHNTLSTAEPSRKYKNRVYSQAKSLSRGMRAALWSQPANTSHQ